MGALWYIMNNFEIEMRRHLTLYLYDIQYVKQLAD